MKDDDSQAGYVHRVHEETRLFTERLLAENQRLRALVATIQSEKLGITEHYLLVQERLDRYQKEKEDLQRQLAEIEAENERFSNRYIEVEQQNSNLAYLYVASYRLHGTLDRQEVLATIQEIIVNLIGSEEVGIFELDPSGSALSLVASFGIEEERLRTIPLGSGLIGSVAVTGEAYVVGERSGMQTHKASAEDGARPPARSPLAIGESDSDCRANHESCLTACIPLKVDGKVIGVIAIFRLLQQKAGVEPVDQELFDLLATHAAMALYCTTLHVKVGAVARS